LNHRLIAAVAVFAFGLQTLPAQIKGAGVVQPPRAGEPGLLFYLSGDRGTVADYAANGKPTPNFLEDVKVMPGGGAKGPYLQCGNDQLLSYWAPGNIYAQRGTLSFFWRSRDTVGATEFPVFRVGYGDHSSWDTVWLRMDYNGHGFDAFVTDINLHRTRVSFTMKPFPKPDEWVHLALTWDETTGIKLYVNGRMVAQKAATGMFDAALDQFGPHSRIIGPTGVEATYNYDRGGDLDELRIYDRALNDDNIATLAKGDAPSAVPAMSAGFGDAATGKEWWYRYGWNRPGDIPEPIHSSSTVVRKVEIHDVYDLGRWWWRATDGIRETTWPGVYNRSKLEGRFDYFQLPDWDTYSLSGKDVTFHMPKEAWNHLEIEGSAWGRMALLGHDMDHAKDTDATLFERPKGQERTFYSAPVPIVGDRLHFTNVEQEEPIGELGAYYVHAGHEPSGIDVLKYKLTASIVPDNPSLQETVNWIDGRFPTDEQMTMVAMPAGAPGKRRTTKQTGLPIVHLLIPADFRDMPPDTGKGYTYTWDNMPGGLDGIAIDLPALKMKPTHGEYIPLNIQVKDPLWPMRDMFDFSFSVKPGEPHTLWLDTRDRILPNDKSLYLTIASASSEFGPDALEGTEVRLIFKPRKDALAEHVADRFTQVRDNYSNMVEENVTSKRLNQYNRYYADITDLLRVDPDNKEGLNYWHEMNKEQARPPFLMPTAPAGTPTWAYLQALDLGALKKQVNWWIDNRQIADGEFGGGISDDSDYMNWWVGTAMMGVDPEKLRKSQSRVLEASYANGMWSNGFAAAQYDELHAYEDGINMLGQAMQLNFGSPKEIERAMLTAKRLEWLTGINKAGNRLIKSSYYSGDKMSTEGVWGWSKANSFFVVHPALSLVLFNGAPETKKMMLEMADGLLAHRKLEKNGRYMIRTTINFETDEDQPAKGAYPWFIFWSAYRWTGDEKYLQPFRDEGYTSLRTINSNALDMLSVRDTWGKEMVASLPSTPLLLQEPTEHVAWQMTGDSGYLNSLYGTQIQTAREKEFMNTEGSLWIDRIYFDNNELQRARLGGIALARGYVYPGNAVSWTFDAPANEQSLGILIPNATPSHMTITAYNLDQTSVTARMTGWEVDPGQWEITQDGKTRTETFERSKSLTFTFAPHQTSTIEMKLVTKGVPYWSRPDLGIDAEDVKVSGGSMKVTVHSLGSVDAPAASLVVRDKAGKVLGTASIPALKAPVDLVPKTAVVSVPYAKGGTVSIEMKGDLPEITLMNNRVELE
jgi:hypothetical protein